jgi:hypothetical protein
MIELIVRQILQQHARMGITVSGLRVVESESHVGSKVTLLNSDRNDSTHGPSAPLSLTVAPNCCVKRTVRGRTRASAEAGQVPGNEQFRPLPATASWVEEDPPCSFMLKFGLPLMFMLKCCERKTLFMTEKQLKRTR